MSETEKKTTAADNSFNARRLWRLYGIVMSVTWLLLLVLVVAHYVGSRRYRQSTTVDLQVVTAAPTAITLNVTATPFVTVEQVVAVDNIEAGATIAPEQVVQRPLPIEHAARGAYTELDDVVGREALRAIVPGAPVTNNTVLGAPPAPDVIATATVRAQTAPPAATPDPLAFVPTPTAFPMRDMVVTRWAIPAGVRLTAQDVYTVRVPLDLVPPDAVTVPIDAIDHTTTVDLAARYPVPGAALLSPQEAIDESVVDGVQERICLLFSDESLTLYNDATIAVSVAATRPSTRLRALTRQGDAYRVALPSGYEIGWVSSASAFTLSGDNCPT